jgi:hypothetical protein
MFNPQDVRRIRELAALLPQSDGSPPSRAQFETLVDKAENANLEEFCLEVETRLAAEKLGREQNAEDIACRLKDLACWFWPPDWEGRSASEQRQYRLECANALRYVNKLRGRPLTDTCAGKRGTES